MTNIQAILFDKDGTLFDFQATWGVWAGRVLRGFAGDDTALLARLADAIDYDLVAECICPGSIVVAGTPFEIAQVLASHVGKSEQDILGFLDDQAALAPQAVVPGMADALAQLQAMGHRLAVMTNDSERAAKAHLTAADLGDYFDLIIGSDSGRGWKPDPDPILSILSDMGIAPQNAVMVGDSLHDLHAGHAAGTYRVGVLTGLAPMVELSPHADVILPNAAALPDWLRNNSFTTKHVGNGGS
ncbi:MAG: HAD family hydrolase [Pseudomonadota bacterium]